MGAFARRMVVFQRSLRLIATFLRTRAHHWAMADASFITLEVPLDSLVEMVYGIGPQTARIAAVLTFLLAAAVTVALAGHGTRGSRAWRRSAVALLSLSAPLCFGGIASLLLEMPNHLGTAAFILFAFLLYARYADRRAAAFILCALLVAGQIGDETVRYIGMDTPESVKPNTPVQCYAENASHENARLLSVGAAVRLVVGAEARDRYGRLLAYVYRTSDGAFINAQLLRGGFAHTLTIAPNDRLAPQFAQLQDQARAAHRGLWQACPALAATYG